MKTGVRKVNIKKKEMVHMESAGMMRWLLTYADMITLMLVFFIIIASISSQNVAKFKEVMVSIQKAFGILVGTDFPTTGTGGRGILKAENAVIKEQLIQDLTLTDVRKYIKEGNTRVFQDERGLIISLSDKTLFPPGSAEIRPDKKQSLKLLSMLFKQIPNNIRIEGHTDNNPIKSSKYPSNWELSTARAVNVLKFFVVNCNINPKKISASGYGEYRPIASNSSEQGRALNRRVDIVILKGRADSEEPK